MEINNHFYSTAHFLPKHLKNSCKSRSGELKTGLVNFSEAEFSSLAAKLDYDFTLPSTWWSICLALNSSESTNRYSIFPLRWNSRLDLWGKQLWWWQVVTCLTHAKSKWRSSRCRTHGSVEDVTAPLTVLSVFFTTAWQIETVVLSWDSKEN